ncbi:MAG: hypothetical protein IJV56_03355 [Neisseriaceae bacterium]|nr:hypothetical protein [Neisseriaceae bacterium]
MKNDGTICLEHGFNQADTIRQLLHHAGFKNIQTLSDLAGLDRVSYGVWQGVQAA